MPGGTVSIGITGVIRTVVIARYAIALGLMGAGLARPGAWVGRRGLATKESLPGTVNEDVKSIEPEPGSDLPAAWIRPSRMEACYCGGSHHKS